MVFLPSMHVNVVMIALLKGNYILEVLKSSTSQSVAQGGNDISLKINISV